MKKILILLLIALVFGGGFWFYFNLSYPKIPKQLKELDQEFTAKNEQLISAEILDQKLDLVAKLIERNLALSGQDSLAEDASMPFLNYITELLNTLNVELVKLEPKRGRSQLDHIKTPYSLSVVCSYDKFGQLISALEKSDRLVTVESFIVDNNYQKATSGARGTRSFEDRLFELEISTLTLIKQ